MTASARIPCPWPDPVLDVIGDQLRTVWGRTSTHAHVHDPFAGSGRIVHLASRLPLGLITGTELEPEFIDPENRPTIRAGDALDQPTYRRLHRQSRPGLGFHHRAIVTSVVYPNGMTDHHDAKDDSTRVTYRHRLGRPLTDRSTAAHGWGRGVATGYRWKRMHVLWVGLAVEWITSIDGPGPRPRSLMVVNIKDHYHEGARVPVVGWMHDVLAAAGGSLLADVQVPLNGMGYGANQRTKGGLKTTHEHVLVYRYKH